MIFHRFRDIEHLWKKHSPSDAFLQFEFFLALENSGSIGESTGWIPLIIGQEETGLLYTFIKLHSYGEFIFDWEWARAYQAHGLDYYPKLTSMVPLTPVNNPHFVMKEFQKDKADLLIEELETYFKNHGLSSSHILFLPEDEVAYFKNRGYMIRESFQYHYENRFRDFKHFLSELKPKKAKHIAQERIFPDLSITKYTGTELTKEHATRMYQFYLTTIDKKDGQAYLTETFFDEIFVTLRDKILYVEATENENPVAGSLFLFDEKRLYGRYWGSLKEIRNLHFELCYYQGMDFCFERKIPLFEAGAQGEHKIPRGFRPVKIFSAHQIKQPAFANAIEKFVESEKGHVEELIAELSKKLPFRFDP